MNLIGIIYEDFVNYKKPCMTLEFPFCDMKCDIENGTNLCQNRGLLDEGLLFLEPKMLIERYKNNRITKAIVCQGLEPFDSWIDLIEFIELVREEGIEDDIVIYTGYTEEELNKYGYIEDLQKYPNIILKVGRFRPNQKPHYDEVIGVELVSDNQYGIKISQL